MISDVNKDQNIIEYYIKSKFNLKIFLRFFLIVLLMLLYNVSFAIELPQYIYNNNNLKPRLYKLCRLNQKYNIVNYIFFNNSKIIFYSPEYLYGTAVQVVDLKTLHITDLKKLNDYYKDNATLTRDIIPYSENEILILTAPNSQNNIELIKYNIAKNKYTNLGLSLKGEDFFSCNQLYKKDPNSICIMCKTTANSINENKNKMYVFNTKTKTISDPLFSDNKEYISVENILNSKQELIKKQIFHINAINDDETIEIADVNDLDSYKNNINDTNIKQFLVARNEVEYGISTNVVSTKAGKLSWYSPIYQYDTKEKEYKPLDQHMRTYSPRYIKIPDKNMILIIGGWTSKNQEYQNADSEKVPYKKRLVGHLFNYFHQKDEIMQPSEEVYLFIY